MGWMHRRATSITPAATTSSRAASGWSRSGRPEVTFESALKYQQHLKALVISNMMSSIPAYNAYAENVLMPAMDQDALAEVKRLEAAKAFDDPRYMDLLLQHHYVH